MGVASSTKEQRRNLKNVIGETAAAAVSDVRELARATQAEHRVLARQMLAFETTVAAYKAARAADRAKIAALEEQLQNVAARLEEFQLFRRGDLLHFSENHRDLAARVSRIERTWRDRLRAWWRS